MVIWVTNRIASSLQSPRLTEESITGEHLALVVFSHCITLPQNEFAHQIHSKPLTETTVLREKNPLIRIRKENEAHTTIKMAALHCELTHNRTFSGSSESGGPRSVPEPSQVFFITSHYVSFDCTPPPPSFPPIPSSLRLLLTFRISPFEVKVASLRTALWTCDPITSANSQPDV